MRQLPPVLQQELPPQSVLVSGLPGIQGILFSYWLFLFFSSLLCFLVFFIMPFEAKADYTVNLANGSTDGILNLDGDTTGGQKRLGTRFTTIGAGSVDTVELCIYDNAAGAADDDITLSIYAESGGVPSGAALGSGTLSAASIDTTHSRKTWTITSTNLNASTNYWVVIEKPTSDGLNYADCGNGASSETAYVYYRNSTYSSFTGTQNIIVYVEEASPPVDNPGSGTIDEIFVQFIMGLGKVLAFGLLFALVPIGLASILRGLARV